MHLSEDKVDRWMVKKWELAKRLYPSISDTTSLVASFDLNQFHHYVSAARSTECWV